MKVRTGLLVLLAFTVLMGFAVPTSAQLGVATAQLNGTVRDASGGAVAKAALTLVETETNRTYSATSTDTGSYVLANVAPGSYELRVSYSGFSNFIQKGIVLTVGQTATINVALAVAAQGQQVVVTAEAPTIEPTKTEISQVIGTTEIKDLPISARLFTDFALLTPGVTTSRTSLGTTFTDFETTQISFAGMRSFSNEYTVDGADFVNASSGVQRFTPPQESVQEFRVVNNSFGTEYGRAVGGIVNIVTKGGTNNWHGSLYEYLQNNATDARSLLQPAPLPYELRQNQFGATIGGPIQKDKTFFFTNYEGKRRAESPTYPPDLVNNLDLIDEAKRLMGLAPEGCTTGLSGCTGSNFGYLDSFLLTGNDDTGFVRLDHQIGDNNRLAVRYNIEDVRALGKLVGQTLDGGGIGVPSGGRNLFVNDQALFGTLDTTLKSNLINTALLQWAQRKYNFYGATGQPDFSLLNSLELGHNFGTQDFSAESRFEFSDSMSWIKGKHVLKFGFDGNLIWSQFNFPGFTPVRLLIPTGAGPADCLASFAKFYNTNYNGNSGTPSAALNAAAATCPVGGDNGVIFTYAGVPLPTDPNFTIGPPLVTKANPIPNFSTTWANAYPPSLAGNYNHTINHGYWGLFVQDQYRITRKLTLNYGVRWDYESGLADYVNRDPNGWQPRVGVAYSPDSKTVIRAGFGIFDDRLNMTFFYVPNTQKVSPGYLCANHASASIVAACNAANVKPQNLPMVASNLLQASQGYQLFAFPAGAGASAFAASVIQTGGYDSFAATNIIQMAGACSISPAGAPAGTPGACGVGSGGMDHNVSRIPYAEQVSAEVDRQFGKGLAVSLGYLFVSAHRLVRGNNINVPCPMGTTDSNQAANPTDPNPWGIAPLSGLPDWVPGKLNADGTFSSCSSGTPILATTGPLKGLGPWFMGAGPASGLQNMSAGLIDYNNGVASANYNGGTLSVTEKVKYFNMTANYTYSHTIDNGNFTTFVNLPVNQFDYNAERANSNQDARHRFITNFSATAPENTFLRHFVFSSIVTLQSGRPFTIFYGANTLNDLAGGATDRVGGAPIDPHCPTPTNCATMVSRNTYIGDPEYTWDARISRYFQVREKLRLDLSVDAFNLGNRPNVEEVSSVYGSPVFCGTTPTIPVHYKDATTLAIQQQAASTACPGGGAPATTPIPFGTGHTLFIPTNPNRTFGLPRTMLNPRQFQFGAKLSF